VQIYRQAPCKTLSLLGFVDQANGAKKTTCASSTLSNEPRLSSNKPE
jgi:hypothetical protein